MEGYRSLGVGATGSSGAESREAGGAAGGRYPQRPRKRAGVDPDSNTDILKANTTLEHKGDEIKLNKVEPAPKNDLSADGTLFYFSRLLALRVEDREVTFATKLGPLDIKCKFALKDMLYRGKLEL